MPDIELTDEQKKCKHVSALKVRVAGETYHGVTQSGLVDDISKVEIVCADCGVCIARAGTIWLNRTEVVRGVILEHWPALIGEERKRCAKSH